MAQYWGDIEGGTPLTLDVIVNADATPPILYQWFKNGVAIAGAVNSVYNFIAQPNDSHASFTVFVQNPCGDELSEPVLLGIVSDQPFCVYYECDSYLNALIASSATAIWPMTDGASSSAGDPITALRGTELILGLGANSQHPGLLDDPCSAELAYGLSSNADVFYDVELTFGVAALISQNAGSTIFLQEYDTNNLNQVGISFVGNDIRISWTTRTTGIESQTFPSLRPADDFILAYTQQFNGAFSVYIDWVLVASGTTPNDTLGGAQTQRLFVSTGGSTNLIMNYASYWTDVISAADITNLRQAWLQQQLSYVDPNPNCQVPSP